MEGKALFIKRCLFGGILVMLLLPMVLTFYPFVTIDPLNGAFEEKSKPKLSWGSWFSGTYQEEMEAFINDRTGGRPYLVRISNQLDYWVFNHANAQAVVVGKEGYLYEKSYINAYYGTDYVGDSVIAEKVRKLTTVADSLAKDGVTLFVAFAPGKASFFPEFLPESVKRKKKLTNYQAYKSAFEKSHLHFIDLKAHFSRMKETSPYPLFPKTGIHWSSYGEVVAADTLIRFMNAITQETQIHTISIDAVKTSKYAYNSDDDIEKSMNLFFDIEDNEMGYPVFHSVAKTEKPVTKVLTVADSYFWGMYHWGVAKYYFNEGPFWYYNHEIYPESFERQAFVKNLPDLTSAVRENDAVLLLFTDANLKDFAYDFVNRLYSEYCENGREIREAHIAKIILDIKNTPEWFEKVKQQAKNNGVSLETALRNNAIYLLDQEAGE